MEITDARINTEVREKGVVFVYYSTNNGTTYLLPEIFIYNDGTPNMKYMFHLHSKLNISIRSYNDEIPARNYLYDEAGTAAKFARFRYVIIPGGLPTGRLKQIDYGDYETVKKEFNIPD